MIARLSLALLSLIVVLTGLELGVRIAFPHVRDAVIPGGFFQIDEELGWRMRPNRSTVHETRYFTAKYETNSRGFRDQERSPEPDPSKRRVLFFGDSHVFGWGVDAEERLSGRVASARPDLEVWNFGVPGYGLDQQILTYRLKAVDLPAGVVVFLVNARTLVRSRLAFAYDKPKPRFTLETDGTLRLHPPEGTGLRELLYEALSSFYLPYFLNQRWNAAREALGEQRSLTWTYENTSPGLDAPLVELAREEAAKRGHGIVFLSTLDEADHERLFGTKADARVVHVSERALDPFRFGEGDPHWNAAGHALVAKALLDSGAF